LLIPAILFWSNWYFYIAGALVAVILLTLYVIIVKPNSAGARKQLLVLAILKNYLKDQKKTK
jgi:MFS superfamily sulfate permease-like transporter